MRTLRTAALPENMYMGYRLTSVTAHDRKIACCNHDGDNALPLSSSSFLSDARTTVKTVKRMACKTTPKTTLPGKSPSTILTTSIKQMHSKPSTTGCNAPSASDCALDDEEVVMRRSANRNKTYVHPTKATQLSAVNRGANGASALFFRAFGGVKEGLMVDEDDSDVNSVKRGGDENL